MTLVVSLCCALTAHAQAPAAPSGLTSSVNGNHVTVAWIGDAAATDYTIQVGSVPGAADLFNAGIGNTTTISGIVPDGTYYWRVLASNVFGSSAPSRDAQFVVGRTCSSAPPPPQGFVHSVAGFIVTLQWTALAVPDAPTTFVIEAGSAAGLADLYNGPTGSVATQLTIGAPAGMYFVRVRARNACGTSAPSNEQVVVVGSGPVTCSYALTPAEQSIPSAGGSFQALVSTQPECPWTASSDQSWLTINGTTSGVGPGIVTISASANTGATRVGQVTAGSALLRATQSAGGSSPTPVPPTPAPGPPPPAPPNPTQPCTYSVSPGVQSVTASGGNFSVQITTGATCTWQAALDVGWLGFASASSGMGSATVQYTVSANNTTALRSGRLTVTGTGSSPAQNYVTTVSQAGVTVPACNYSLTPSPLSIPVAGGLFSFQISTTAGCGSVATADLSWLRIVGTDSGSQSHSVALAVDANSGSARSGSITVLTPTGNHQLAVSQAAAPPPVALTAAFSVDPFICPLGDAGQSGLLLCTFDGRLSTPESEILNYKWLIGTDELTGAVLVNPAAGSVANVGGFGYHTRNVTLTVRGRAGQEASVTRGVTFFTPQLPDTVCVYSVSPPSATIPAAGGTFQFTVMVGTACPSWYPGVLSPTSSWITGVEPISGVGSGPVRYTAAPNTTGSTRSGTIRVFHPNGSTQFSVTQPAQ